MRWPIYFMGVMCLLLGGGIVIKPEIVARMIDTIDGIKQRIYAVGVFRVILGSLLIASSGNARLSGFILFFGILILLGGIGCFAIPHRFLIKFLAWYRERTVLTYRLLGILLLVLSSIFLFAC